MHATCVYLPMMCTGWGAAAKGRLLLLWPYSTSEGQCSCAGEFCRVFASRLCTAGTCKVSFCAVMCTMLAAKCLHALLSHTICSMSCHDHMLCLCRWVFSKSCIWELQQMRHISECSLCSLLLPSETLHADPLPSIFQCSIAYRWLSIPSAAISPNIRIMCMTTQMQAWS